MVAETQELIGQAHDVSRCLEEMLRNNGCENPDDMRRVFQSDQCPPELRQQAQEELDNLMRELAEEERLMTDAKPRAGKSRGGHMRRGMTRI